MVPAKYDEDPPFGRWVAKQRQEYETKLPPQKKDKLKSVGFVWTLDPQKLRSHSQNESRELQTKYKGNMEESSSSAKRKRVKATDSSPR
mmetsp:Transcript_18502/g.28228  ORF Transcript_18502/g.28228 Transcript_18502/m.28228 type:complete len:89 (+) Transcript_18502:335-601(+)